MHVWIRREGVLPTGSTSAFGTVFTSHFGQQSSNQQKNQQQSSLLCSEVARQIHIESMLFQSHILHSASEHTVQAHVLGIALVNPNV